MAGRKVLLVGWDAADWRVIHPLTRAGKMPCVARLIDGGASGPIATLQPAFSPMLWTSIATGKRPFKHGILGFTEPGAGGRGVRPITNLSRKCKALWNILNQNARRSAVVGWWPSHPAEPIDGVMVSDRYHRVHGPLDRGWPMPSGAVYPPDLAEPLARLRIHPEQLAPELVERFVPRAREIDQDQDKRLSALLRTLAECLTIQSAAAWLIEQEPWDFFAVYFESIDHFSHGFMRYHPPRQAWIGERDFDLYREVISNAYQLHDEMLGALIEKAGDATVILVSDHGFHPDRLRPMAIPDIPAGPAVEHRDFGIFVMAGPDICPGTRLEGISILDVAPTVLALSGLPAGEDMDGRVLTKAFDHPPPGSSVPSWEEIAGHDGRHPAGAFVDAVAGREMLEQMIALGYVERPAGGHRAAAERSIRELRSNLAGAYQDAGRHGDALEILTSLAEAYPEEARFAVLRFASCQALGMIDEMRRIVEDLRRRLRSESRLVGYLSAQILIAERRDAEALPLLRKTGGDPSTSAVASAEILSQTGDVCFRLRRWPEARRMYRKALLLDPDHPRAHLGQCRLALRERKFRAAAQSALAAIHQAQNPVAHFLLGRALAGMKQHGRAADAFRFAIALHPNFPEAQRGLARLLEKYLGDAESAREHRRLGELMTGPVESQVVPSQPVRPAEVAPPRPDLSTGSCAQDYVIVVTGLPRSGTSMIMQMLSAGRIPILSDRLRQPDEDNPRGYFEFEPAKRLAEDSSWLEEARGKAVKIVVPLLSALPASLACRVIFCERDLEEILNSQDTMLRRRGRTAISAARRETLRQEYRRALAHAKTLLQQRPSTEILGVDHREVLADPLLAAEKISLFLGAGTEARRMASIVEAALYRHRASAAV